MLRQKYYLDESWILQNWNGMRDSLSRVWRSVRNNHDAETQNRLDNENSNRGSTLFAYRSFNNPVHEERNLEQGQILGNSLFVEESNRDSANSTTHTGSF